MRHRALSCVLAVALAAAAPPVRGGPGASSDTDTYLRGYIESWLEQSLALPRSQVKVEVRDGVVTLSGSVDTPERIDLIVKNVATFEGVIEVVDRLQAGSSEGRYKTWMLWPQPPPGRRSVRFPAGDLFSAPLADQKQPRFHTTYQRWRTENGIFDIASVGFGEDFGLLRRPGGREGDGWQVGISGAVFAIFNLDTGSKDLLNADYIVGFPISYRSGEWSARLRIFHQSSHVGDEFLLQPLDQQPLPQVQRINLSYEAIELLASLEQRGFRVYGGGTRIFASDTSLGRQRLQVGVDYRGNPLDWRTARLVAGLDLEAWDETHWDRDYSAKAGLMFRSPYGEARSTQILLEYYNGHAPHGQFFHLNVEYFGLGIAYVF
jgi:Protein of unknown function (DUF1207)/BON domain